MSKQNKYNLENVPRLFNLPCKVLEFGWLPNHIHHHRQAVVEGGFVCLSCNFTEQSIGTVNGVMYVKNIGDPPKISLLLPGMVLNTIKSARHDEIFFRYSAEGARFLANFFGVKEGERFNISVQGFPADILSELSKAVLQLDTPGAADRIDILAIRLFSETVLRKIRDDDSSGGNEVKLAAIAGKLVQGRELKELLKEYGLSERSFYRQWQNVYSVSPREYVINAQLKKACSLLTGSDISVEDIAAESGFVSSNYFYKLFRKKLNTTPSKYRKKHSGKLFGAVEVAKV